jgi:diguanylate cyclase (GGDEF)-like protein
MKKKKILVIEDDNLFREVLSELLSLEGYEVIQAADGEEGWEKLKEIPDVVLLDRVMPKMDGIELLKKIRENPYYSAIPVVLLTGMSEEESQLEGLALGADDYLVKTLNTEILLAKIKILIKHKDIRLNINPLTGLPGNILIQQEIETRVLKDTPFILFYIDMNNFKAYNDYYGFAKGDKIIKHTAEILTEVIKNFGEKDDFVGHIGGDDFVIISSSKDYKKIAEKIIEKYDSTIKSFYDEKDIEKGFIKVTDRDGELKEFPIMGIAIVAIPSWKIKVLSFEELSKRSAELKKYAKQFNKSIFVEERRT